MDERIREHVDRIKSEAAILLSPIADDAEGAVKRLEAIGESAHEAWMILQRAETVLVKGAEELNQSPSATQDEIDRLAAATAQQGQLKQVEAAKYGEQTGEQTGEQPDLDDKKGTWDT